MNEPSRLPRHVIRLGERREATSFEIAPEAEGRAAVAEELGIPGVRKLRFSGRLVPEGRRDWRLEAELGATVVQDCVVTLEPVPQRVEEEVALRLLPPGQEPRDDPDEAADEIATERGVADLGEAVAEQLALALDPYPRVPGATLPAEASEAAEHPMASLAKLRGPQH